LGKNLLILNMSVQELWAKIFSYLPTFLLMDVARDWGMQSTASQKAHESLWKTLFKDESWLQDITERFQLDPTLIGPDLQRYYRDLEQLEVPNKTKD